MFTIKKATFEDAILLAELGKASFIESHGSSASEADIDLYVSEKYTVDVVKMELADPANVYYLIYWGDEPAGYSKIIFDAKHPNIPVNPSTKLERLYLLKEFYDLKLGYKLLEFNIDLAKSKGQMGMWLFVWKENYRAVNFYIKNKFEIIGSYDFKLTPTHSNPNHQMLLLF